MDTEKTTEAEASTTSSGDLSRFLEDEGGNRGPEEIPSEVSLEARPPASEGRGRKKIFPRLSARMEYLARPKKDFLDEEGLERLEGSIPENALPTWGVLPLQSKLPVAWYPREITMTDLTSNIFLPPGKSVDLFDAHNRQLPVSSYSSLRDPQLKTYFKNNKIRKNLRKRGLISESGKVITSLRDLNDYREYQRRIQAQRLHQKYRDQHEEEKRNLELQLKQRICRAEEKVEDKRSQTILRSYIKNAAAFIKEGSMTSQRENDLKVLNREFRLREELRIKTLAKQDRYQRIYAQHMKEKYDREEWKRLTLLRMAKKDIVHLEKICLRQEQEQIERKIKLEDFWSRKADEQIKWLEKGIELENKWLVDREEKIKDRKTRPQRMAERHRTDGKTLDEILKNEEEAASLENILRDEAMQKNSENDQRNGEILTTTDLEVTDAPIKTNSQTLGESSQAELDPPAVEKNVLEQSINNPSTKVTDQISEKSIDVLENDQKQDIQDISQPNDEKSKIKDLKSQDTDQKVLAEYKDSPKSLVTMVTGTKYQDTGNKWVDSGYDANVVKQPDAFDETKSSVGGVSVEDPRRKSVKSLQKSKITDVKLESTEQTLRSDTDVAKYNAFKLLEPALEHINYETELNDSDEHFSDANDSFDDDIIKQKSLEDEPEE